MTVTVLLFARYREVAGVPALTIEARDGATMGEIWESVRHRCPGLAAEARPLMALDRSYSGPGSVVRPGSEIAFFPPVSGG